MQVITEEEVAQNIGHNRGDIVLRARAALEERGMDVGEANFDGLVMEAQKSSGLIADKINRNLDAGQQAAASGGSRGAVAADGGVPTIPLHHGDPSPDIAKMFLHVINAALEGAVQVGSQNTPASEAETAIIIAVASGIYTGLILGEVARNGYEETLEKMWEMGRA